MQALVLLKLLKMYHRTTVKTMLKQFITIVIIMNLNHRAAFSKNTNEFQMTPQKKIAKKIILTSKNGILNKTAEIYYDQLGNEIKQIEFSADNKIASTIIKKYTKNGILISMEINDTSEVKSKWKYKNSFNASQQLQKSIATQPNTKKVQTYHYNEDSSYEVTTVTNDVTISIKHFNPNKKLVKIINLINNNQTILTYDTHNNLTEQKEIRIGRPNRIITYSNEYNQKNQLVTVRSGNIITQFFYNENGDITEEIHKKDDGTTTMTILYQYEYQ